MIRFAVLVMIVVMPGCCTNKSGDKGGSSSKIEDPPKLAILTKVIADVLTNPSLEAIRRDYGQPGRKIFALVNNKEFHLLWPEGFAPDISGYSYSLVMEGRFGNRDAAPLLGIRLDRFHAQLDRDDSMDTNISVTVFNVGGYMRDKESVPIGGCSIRYTLERVGDDWAVQLDSWDAQ